MSTKIERALQGEFGDLDIRQSKRVGKWNIKRTGPSSLQVDDGWFADFGSLQHDGSIYWDRPEAIPKYVERAAYQALLAGIDDRAARESKGTTRLVFLPANQAYAFIFGDQLLRMDDEEMFFETKAEARAAARRHGLAVDKKGVVS